MRITVSSNKTHLLSKYSLALMMSMLCSVFLYSQKNTEPVWSEKGNNKNFTFYEVQQDFNKYWQGKTPRKGQGYKVFKRWEEYMAPRVYPTGNMTLPSTNYANFLKWQGTNGGSERSPSGNWIEVGPLSKPTGYDAGVGRVDFIHFDPTNSNTMYVSTPDGGLWKTTNGNAALPTWTTNNDFLPVIGCSDLAIAPGGTTMYLATGSWESDKRSLGILKSTDGGATWTTTGLTWMVTDDYKIRRLIMDPSNPLIMMAATDGGVFRTTDGWATTVLNPVATLDGSNNIHDIKFKPGDPSTVYASGRNTSTTNVFWKSTDNGATWSPITSGLPVAANVSRIILGVTSANTAYVYALAGNTDGGYLGTYRSSDGGTTFSTQSTTPNILSSSSDGSGTGGQAGHDLAIAVSPTDPNLLTIGGISQWRSTDGGVTWAILTFWYGTDPLTPGGSPGIAPYLHADVQAIEYLPGSSTTLFSTCDGGISRSTDHGVSWTYIANNLRVAQETDVALSSNDAILITGLQDIGSLKRDGDPWTYIGGGDGESTFIDRSNNQNIVISDPNGNHSLSIDGGSVFNTLNGNGLPVGTEFFSPIIQDPVTATTCYAGGRPDLYKSTNFLDAATNTHTWTSIGTPSGTGSVTRFVVAPSNTQIIYTLKGDAVSKTTNGGTTWTNITGTLPVGTANIRNITISNTDPLKVWVVFSGYNAATKVFKTTDGGATWTNVFSTGLPNIPINTIIYRNNSANDEVYIGADIGVYVIDNTLSAWVPFFTGLARCTVTDLEIYYPTGRLRAATYGRGTWESNLFTGPQAVSVAIKVYLQGPYNVGAGTMNDGLRAGGYIPTTDPNPGFGFTQFNGEIEGTNTAVLAQPDVNNAIVDWVFVELRNKNNPTTKLYTRSALVQRDGDVVDMDGLSPLHFSNAPADNYYVAVRHRSHLGFRTLNSIALSTTPASLNFTNNSVPTFGTGALNLLAPGIYGMYSGDANRDGQVNAVDLNAYWQLQNGNPFFYLSTAADFNLDGAINAVDLNAHWVLNNSFIQQLD